MSNEIPSEELVCSRCGKSLQEFPCDACDGKGYIREWIIMKQECQACDGFGIRMRCPDELAHIIEDFRLSREARRKAIYRGFQRRTAFKVLGQEIGRGVRKQQIPSPWHPSYPNPWHPAHPRHPSKQPWHPSYPHPWHPAHPRHRKPFKK